jgi:hypothetical protein
MVGIQLYSNQNAEYFYQEKQVFPWPSAPAHEQRSALVNCWTGNQLPGDVNFIPGVAASYHLWNIPTSYANTFKNQQFNRGFNIQNETPMQQADLLQQAITNWQNRMQY